MADLFREIIRLSCMDEASVRRAAGGEGSPLTSVAAKVLLHMIDSKDACDDEEGKWVTINGARFKIENGRVVSGPKKARSALNRGSTNRERRDKIELDKHGNRWAHPTKRLPTKEYSKVVHEIDTVFASKYKGQQIGFIVTHPPGDEPPHMYFFEIHEYEGDYPEFNIIAKRKG